MNRESTSQKNGFPGAGWSVLSPDRPSAIQKERINFRAARAKSLGGRVWSEGRDSREISIEDEKKQEDGAAYRNRTDT